jgi:CSLREA domain-containing protein
MNAGTVRFLFATIIAGMIAIMLLAEQVPIPARAQRRAPTNAYNVNSTLDEPNPDPSLGICTSTPSGVCTLRAAIQVANLVTAPNTINIPSGTFVLTRSGYDDGAVVGDLDIAHDLTIQGAGSGATIIDGNGSVTNDRVFQILSSASYVTMTGMTIQNGKSMSSTVGVIGGGGVYMEGTGHLKLSNVIVDSNTGKFGGGVYANFPSGGSLALDNVTLHANTAIAGVGGGGGGIFVHLPTSSLGGFTMQDSQVYSNTADIAGGGILVDGDSSGYWTIQRSQIYSNTAAVGGGIGNFVPLALSDSYLHNNSVGFDGGAIQAFAPLSMLRTTLDSNSASRFGGAIFNNQTDSNGSYPEFAHIEQSTLTGNFALYGGAIYHRGFTHPESLLTVLNSTLSGNGVSKNGGGGGVYIEGGQTQLLNATVASNLVHLGYPLLGTGIGGGLYITASATFTAQNSLIAYNARGNGITVYTPDDCFSSGTVGELAYDLILTTTNCSITGPQGNNIVGQDPLLGPLQNNGGSTQTRALLPGSPAIDAGPLAGCTGVGAAPLTTDQRGFPRPANGAGSFRCDMGAYELQRVLFLPLIMK